MRVTEVRIKLLPNEGSGDKLRGFCSITLEDDFVIRDLKIIEGAQGIFIAMPSRKVAHRCPHPSCRAKNHLRARFCNDCGGALSRASTPRDTDGRTRLHVDIAHPINAGARQKIHDRVVEEFHRELDRSKHEGYVFATWEDLDDGAYDETPPTSSDSSWQELEGGAS